LNRFLDVFQADGTQRLSVDIHPTKPLLFEVYNESGVSVSKRWSDEVMIGTFTLKLIEPEPVKRVVRHQRISEATKTLTITMTTSKAVTIHWGDGAKDYDVFGSNITVSHSYSADGMFYAVISGVIEEITDFSTSGIVVWNKI
jgi:PKD repeat protein